jgi:hypothetical protein
MNTETTANQHAELATRPSWLGTTSRDDSVCKRLSCVPARPRLDARAPPGRIRGRLRHELALAHLHAPRAPSEERLCPYWSADVSTHSAQLDAGDDDQRQVPANRDRPALMSWRPRCPRRPALSPLGAKPHLAGDCFHDPCTLGADESFGDQAITRAGDAGLVVCHDADRQGLPSRAIASLDPSVGTGAVSAGRRRQRCIASAPFP